jgi:MoaA/NifB/PqqE/SkfB family radical SAM enzyme
MSARAGRMTIVRGMRMVKTQYEVETAQAHQVMLEIAEPTDQGRSSWRRGRARYLSKLRLLKLRFMIAQRGFLRRAANALVWLLERGRVSKVHYLPSVVAVESVNGCNLRCPECPTGTSDPLGRRKGKAKLQDMKSVIDQVAGKCLQMSFHNQGEPLLNDDFYAACAYAVGKGLWTVIHSNLSIRSKDLAQRIVSSRLCNLVVSCDGVTQEVYEKYRVGGDVELVFENMRAIAEEKRKAGRRLPWITAQFLVFDHNWWQMKRFQERALSAGANEILFLPGYRNGTVKSGHVGAEQVFQLSQLDWIERKPASTCCDVWDTLLIAYDGGLYPCCFSYRDQDLFSAPEEASEFAIADRWNGPAYRAARRFFLGNSMPLKDLPEPCRCCERAVACENRRKAGRGD